MQINTTNAIVIKAFYYEAWDVDEDKSCFTYKSKHPYGFYKAPVVLYVLKNKIYIITGNILINNTGVKRRTLHKNIICIDLLFSR